MIFSREIKLCILLCGLSLSMKPACDSTSNSTQCRWKEVCRNSNCVSAQKCRDDSDCETSETSCNLGYCQVTPCRTTGECVYGNVCSRYGPGVCLDPVTLSAEEGSTLTLHFQDDIPIGEKYKKIVWLKGHFDRKYEIAVYNEFESYIEPTYFDTFCNCNLSERLTLNKETGDLIVRNVTMDDEGDYFYYFVSKFGFPNMGQKYQTTLIVGVKPQTSDIHIEGIPDQVYEGDEIFMSCFVNRIKPRPLDIHWQLNYGSVGPGHTSISENEDGTYKIENTLTIRITRRFYRRKIQCFVKTQHEEIPSVLKTFNILRDYNMISNKTLSGNNENEEPKAKNNINVSINQTNIHVHLGTGIGVLVVVVIVTVALTLYIRKRLAAARQRTRAVGQSVSMEPRHRATTSLVPVQVQYGGNNHSEAPSEEDQFLIKLQEEQPIKL